ncbi:MAG: SDR family oxidoreductase [Oscillatoria sp. SIO1A7]|nr:SDR family oxidoreductase [Oscillatoria sp. SIO1A7]
MARLNGKTAVITGGTSGIGFATARLFLEEGARVIVTGQNETRLQEAAQKLGDNASPVLANVKNLAELDRLAERVAEIFGSIDVLFVNAGVAKVAPFKQVTEARFDEEMAINLKGAFFTVQKLEPVMKDGGSIILTTTCLDQTAMMGESVYSASKAAVRSLARSFSLELLDRKIRVNAIAPGAIETPIWSKIEMPQEAMEQAAQQVIARTPAGRFGKPEEIAKAVLFLASDDSSFMLGEEILVDGGWATL